ncbi:MAG: SIR2 family protein [Euryarchaeota archaeon]|nr:SIR2 family protein [Euryarchaeota archaeon]
MATVKGDVLNKYQTEASVDPFFEAVVDFFVVRTATRFYQAHMENRPPDDSELEPAFDTSLLMNYLPKYPQLPSVFLIDLLVQRYVTQDRAKLYKVATQLDGNGGLVIAGAGISYGPGVGIAYPEMVRSCAKGLGIDVVESDPASPHLLEPWCRALEEKGLQQQFQLEFKNASEECNPTRAHDWISAWQYGGVVDHVATTNWDDLFEKAFEKIASAAILRGKLPEVIIGNQTATLTRVLWKLHGSVRQPNQPWILCHRSTVAEALKETYRKGHKSHCVLVVGSRLADSALNEFLEVEMRHKVKGRDMLRIEPAESSKADPWVVVLSADIACEIIGKHMKSGKASHILAWMEHLHADASGMKKVAS